jgi:hypothetical protein
VKSSTTSFPLSSKFRTFFGISEELEPGFIRSVPFLLILRYLILVAIILRFSTHRTDYPLQAWHIVEFCGLGFRRSSILQATIVVLDTLLIASLYTVTLNPESDFFLFFYLPVLTATEHIGKRGMVLSSIGISISFACVLIFQKTPMQRSVPSGWGLLSRVFIPREIFFLSVVLTSCLVLLLERKQRERALRSTKEVSDLLHFRTTIDEMFSVHEIFHETVTCASSLKLADWAEIRLLDRATGKLDLAFCLNTPNIVTGGVANKRELAAQAVFRTSRPTASHISDDGHFEMCIKLPGTGAHRGTLCVGRRAASFIPDEITLLTAIASHSASALGTC